MEKCLLISFTFSKKNDGYPLIPYSISSILAKFKNSDYIDMELSLYNINEYFEYTPKNTETRIINDFKEKYLNKLKDFKFIAISAYSWSENLVNRLLEIIKNVFHGKTILGGYEITALDKKQLLEIYPDVDYYIKGYAEISLEMIFKNKTKQNILNEEITENDLVSVYLTDTVHLTTENIYWESKRGCPYHCDFCEWGNAGNRKIIRINEKRINDEINLFKKNKIKKINVLDGTFLLNEQDINTLEKLIEIQNCEFVLQVNFLNFKNSLKDKFLSICKKHKDRIILEFGLQTIHENEMKTINRTNDIEQIKLIMEELNRLDIKYEISIIFGIPGQTIDSFQRTIKFVEENGCKEYKGFPLRLPQNSKMKKNADKLKIKEEFSPFDAYPIKFVTESFSFTRLDWEIMYSLANKKMNKENVEQVLIPTEFVPIMREITNYHILNKKRNKIISNMDNGFLLSSNEEKELKATIYEHLCKNDISKTMLIGTGADNFAHAINDILSEKSIRELCIKDNKFAKHITQYILDFITKTKQHILNIDNPFKNEKQSLLKCVSSTPKNFEESWKIAAPFIQQNYNRRNIDTIYYYKEFQRSLSPKKEKDNNVKFEDVMKKLTDEWGKLLAQKELEWEFDIIDKKHKTFCEELYKKIEQLNKS
jgi:hypothetical protein